MHAGLISLTLAGQVLSYALQSYAYPAVPIATGQPLQVTYQATFQPGKSGAGYVAGTTNDDGTGVRFNIDLTELSDQGPFAYHIHVNQVPEDGNCTAAGPHLIPFDGPPDSDPCNATATQFCQVGDLSGKHGKIVAEDSKFKGEYLDVYVATTADSPAFFGNRSLVLHNINGTRINCANFILQENATGPTHSDNSTTVQPSQTATATGGASSVTDGAAPPAEPPAEPSSTPGAYSGNTGNSLDSSYSMLISIGLIGLAAAVWQ